MAKKRTKGIKYSRITKQQKYIFLNLCISQHQSIYQAAFHSGIHYSTAKTILFFHRKQYKNYTSYVIDEVKSKEQVNQLPRAVYRSIPQNVDAIESHCPHIQIISNSLKAFKIQALQQKIVKADKLKEERESSYVKIEGGCFGNHFQFDQRGCKKKGELTTVKLEQDHENQKAETKVQAQWLSLSKKKSSHYF